MSTPLRLKFSSKYLVPNPEFLYANCGEVNFNPKFSREELKIEVLLSNKISSPLQFITIYPHFLLFFIDQLLYLFQIDLDFLLIRLDLSTLQLDLFELNDSFYQIIAYLL